MTSRTLPHPAPYSLAALAAVIALALAGCFDSSTGNKTEEPVVTPPAPLAPVITGQPRDTTVSPGETAAFVVTATGALSYQWVRNVDDTLAGQNTPVLLVPDVALIDDGNTYKCVVGNAGGRVTSSFGLLRVEPPPASPAPAITVQPASRVVMPGDTAVFSVTATGANLRYQWYRWSIQSPVVGGRAATLKVTQVPEDLGIVPYFCVVSNAHGDVVSDTVTLRADATRAQLLARGAVVYQNCATCHGADGRGAAGSVPPLANADFVMANRRRTIEITVAGASDSMRVNGAWYHGAMPAFGETLNALETASVLTYIRAALNDSTVVGCDANVLDGRGMPVCQKTPRTPQQIAADSIPFQEVYPIRDSLLL